MGKEERNWAWTTLSEVEVDEGGGGRRSRVGEGVKLKSPTRQIGEEVGERVGSRVEMRKAMRSEAEVEGQ